MSQKAGKVWREHGALEYLECVADDVKPGKLTSFPERQAQGQRDGGLLLDRLQVARASRSRKAKVMKDPRLAAMMDPKSMPFDAKRMIWGGFKVFVDE